MSATETKVTHTPGPWDARRKVGDTDSWWVTAGPPRPGHRGFLAECVARQSENEANAILISAAPDLLAACKNVLACCALEDISAAAYAPLVAAIAKAEGQ